MKISETIPDTYESEVDLRLLVNQGAVEMLPQKGEINILCKGEVNGRTSIEAVEVWKPYPCKRETQQREW